jgi:dipeptidyl aminopeptidase/acylaminoacyl peptidase
VSEPKPEPVSAEPRSRRWIDQRWALDNMIASNGIDWDQPRSFYLNAACGMEAGPDFASIRQQVRKFADIAPAFEVAARRRQAKARAAEDAAETVTARDNYFIAAIHWGAAQWPHHFVNAANIEANKKKRECYTAYARLASHRIEPVWIPFQGKQIPAWFHLPPNYDGARVPVVVSFPGLDTFKEVFVALANDRWLSRGVAVLAVDGPGQSESRVLGHRLSIPGFIELGTRLVDWLTARQEIDPARMGIFGNSLGSLLATVIAANEPRFCACATSATCLEPGLTTMIESASPTYKQRLMYVTGYSDEREFDTFSHTLTWEGHAEKLRVPYLAVAGGAEELSPLEHAERMLRRLKVPKRFVIYEESRHAVGQVPSTNLGPYPPTLIADWMVARFAGKPLTSERWYVDRSGTLTRAALD